MNNHQSALDQISKRLLDLKTLGYTGNMFLTIRLHQGGIREVRVNEEYPLSFDQKPIIKKVLDTNKS